MGKKPGSIYLSVFKTEIASRMAYSSLKIARKYIHYYLTAANGRGHGIHSPFVYDLVRNVLHGAVDTEAYAAIGDLRRRLLVDERMLEVEDMGAGPAMKTANRRRTRDIAKRAAKPAKLGQLLHRMARHYQPSAIVELGTSLGLSTAYLASGASDARIYTIEGADAVAAVAKENFDRLRLYNITQCTGNFDAVLGTVLDQAGPVDFAFIDGNHRKEPVLRYFDMLMEHSTPSSVLIFDDVHWSSEMEEAWDMIKADPRVYLTVDLFFLGLVFRREEFKVKQDFIVRF